MHAKIQRFRCWPPPSRHAAIRPIWFCSSTRATVDRQRFRRQGSRSRQAYHRVDEPPALRRCYVRQPRVRPRAGLPRPDARQYGVRGRQRQHLLRYPHFSPARSPMPFSGAAGSVSGSSAPSPITRGPAILPATVRRSSGSPFPTRRPKPSSMPPFCGPRSMC